MGLFLQVPRLWPYPPFWTDRNQKRVKERDCERRREKEEVAIWPYSSLPPALRCALRRLDEPIATVATSGVAIDRDAGFCQGKRSSFFLSGHTANPSSLS